LTLEKISKASGRLRRQSGKEFLFAIPCKLFSYVIAHTVADKLIYPGSISLIGWALGNITIVIVFPHVFMLSFCIAILQALRW